MSLCVDDLELRDLSENLKRAEKPLQDMRQLIFAYNDYIRLRKQREIYLKADDEKEEGSALLSMEILRKKMKMPVKVFSSGSEQLSDIIMATDVEVTLLHECYEDYEDLCSAFEKWQKL